MVQVHQLRSVIGGAHALISLASANLAEVVCDELQLLWAEAEIRWG